LSTSRFESPVAQFDFYDADTPVAAAADFVAAHFRARL
jgi:hypothetical protein